MNTSTVVAITIAELCLTIPAGFLLGRFIYNTPRGIAMNARIKRRASSALDWIGQDRRLVALVVATVLFVLAGYGYTYQANKASQDTARREKAALVDCIGNYVEELSKTQGPRTAASVAANDARRDWDRGYSKAHPELDKAQLKDRYLRLYAAYELVRVGNPPPTVFSLEFCQRAAHRAR